MTQRNLGHIGVGQSRGVSRGRGRQERRAAVIAPTNHSDVRAFVCDYMQKSDGRPPSVREIATGTRRRLESVQRALQKLEEQCLIERGQFGQTRGIRIVGARYVLPDGAMDREGHERQTV